MLTPIQLPDAFDWKPWITRWERMQDSYLVKRAQRFAFLIELIESTQRHLSTIIEPGCGPGSLTVRLLEAFPHAQVIGIDLDPTLLALAEQRTAKFQDRVQFLQRDLRGTHWMDDLPGPANAIVSSTALHWLNKPHLRQFYRQIVAVLDDRGIFLNADHVGSDFGQVQRLWERRRKAMRAQTHDPRAEDWDAFMAAYLRALGGDAATIREQALGAWEGSDKGVPLHWHLDHLRKAGFKHVECFWRIDCDAIYGGILRQ